MTRTFLFLPTGGVPGVTLLGFAVAGFLASECRSTQRPECSILKPHSRTHIDPADGREYPWGNTLRVLTESHDAIECSSDDTPEAVSRRYFFSVRGTDDGR